MRGCGGRARAGRLLPEDSLPRTVSHCSTSAHHHDTRRGAPHEWPRAGGRDLLPAHPNIPKCTRQAPTHLENLKKLNSTQQRSSRLSTRRAMVDDPGPRGAAAAVAVALQSLSVVSALAVELDAALSLDPAVDELAFLPSALPIHVFGPREADQPAVGPGRCCSPPPPPSPPDLDPASPVPPPPPPSPHSSPPTPPPTLHAL